MQLRPKRKICYTEPELSEPDEPTTTATRKLNAYRSSESTEDDGTYASRNSPAKKRRTTRRRSQKTSFPFLKLPPEIRNLVYELALIDSPGIELVNRTKSYGCTVTEIFTPWYNDRAPGSGKPYPNEAVASGILAVNRQIRGEVRSYFRLHEEHIRSEDCLALSKFLKSIRPDIRKLVTKISVRRWKDTGSRWPLRTNNANIALLGQCTHLTSLEIHATIGPYEDLNILAKEVYREMGPAFDVAANATGKNDALVKLICLHPSSYSRASHLRYIRLSPADDPISPIHFKVSLTRLVAFQRCGLHFMGRAF